jgi:hypothetical protein
MGALSETRGRVEVGARYYQRAAAGTVMIGEAANCEAYKELFGWPEAVIQICLNGSDSDPERIAAISRRNAKEALLRHDWDGCNEMFRVAGIQPSPHMAARERHKIMTDFVASVKKKADTASKSHTDPVGNRHK